MSEGFLEQEAREAPRQSPGGKRIPHFMRPRIPRMALQTRLHPNRANRVPKMLLGIAEDVLGHGLRQRIVRFIMDRNVSHGDAHLSRA